jgi:hypothetical protein
VYDGRSAVSQRLPKPLNEGMRSAPCLAPEHVRGPFA